MSDDKDLFQRALQDVVPLKKRAAKVAHKPAARKRPPKSAPAEDVTRPARGRSGYDARLDLHGHTQDAAYEALCRFLESSQRRGLRHVLIITGRSGVLHDVVPKWLTVAPNRARVEAHVHAPIADGGAGALDVLIKRAKV